MKSPVHSRRISKSLYEKPKLEIDMKPIYYTELVIKECETFLSSAANFKFEVSKNETIHTTIKTTIPSSSISTGPTPINNKAIPKVAASSSSRSSNNKTQLLNYDIVLLPKIQQSEKSLRQLLLGTIEKKIALRTQAKHLIVRLHACILHSSDQVYTMATPIAELRTLIDHLANESLFIKKMVLFNHELIRVNTVQCARQTGKSLFLPWATSGKDNHLKKKTNHNTTSEHYASDTDHQDLLLRLHKLRTVREQVVAHLSQQLEDKEIHAHNVENCIHVRQQLQHLIRSSHSGATSGNNISSNSSSGNSSNELNNNNINVLNGNINSSNSTQSSPVKLNSTNIIINNNSINISSINYNIDNNNNNNEDDHDNICSFSPDKKSIINKNNSTINANNSNYDTGNNSINNSPTRTSFTLSVPSSSSSSALPPSVLSLISNKIKNNNSKRDDVNDSNNNYNHGNNNNSNNINNSNNYNSLDKQSSSSSSSSLSLSLTNPFSPSDLIDTSTCSSTYYDHSRCQDCSYSYAIATDCIDFLTALDEQTLEASKCLKNLIEMREILNDFIVHGKVPAVVTASTALSGSGSSNNNSSVSNNGTIIAGNNNKHSKTSPTTTPSPSTVTSTTKSIAISSNQSSVVQSVTKNTSNHNLNELTSRIRNGISVSVDSIHQLNDHVNQSLTSITSGSGNPSSSSGSNTNSAGGAVSSSSGNSIASGIVDGINNSRANLSKSVGSIDSSHIMNSYNTVTHNIQNNVNNNISGLKNVVISKPTAAVASIHSSLSTYLTSAVTTSSSSKISDNANSNTVANDSNKNNNSANNSSKSAINSNNNNNNSNDNRRNTFGSSTTTTANNTTTNNNITTNKTTTNTIIEIDHSIDINNNNNKNNASNNASNNSVTNNEHDEILNIINGRPTPYQRTTQSL